jgi:hypothetical protein
MPMPLEPAAAATTAATSAITWNAAWSFVFELMRILFGVAVGPGRSSFVSFVVVAVGEERREIVVLWWHVVGCVERCLTKHEFPRSHLLSFLARARIIIFYYIWRDHRKTRLKVSLFACW